MLSVSLQSAIEQTHWIPPSYGLREKKKEQKSKAYYYLAYNETTYSTPNTFKDFTVTVYVGKAHAFFKY